MELKLGSNEIYRDALLAASRRTGIDASALAALVDAEAARRNGLWQADSYNRSSGAAGLTQFLASTWIEQAQLPGTLLNRQAAAAGYLVGGKVLAMREKALLQWRFDPVLSIVAAAEYGARNLALLAERGALPAAIDDDERARYMYLAHHEGVGGAIGFLSGTRRYSRRNLVGQVGETMADGLIAASGGDASRAYRAWLQGYIDRKIVPARFRDEAVVQPPGRSASTM